ncbi:hypothetical protein Ancab_001781 [Ancistrocladus abbreviatus]
MAAESTIQDFCRFLEQEKGLIYEGKEDLEDLASQLKLTNAFIKSREGNPDQNDVEKETIRRLNNVASEAEGLIKYVMIYDEKEKNGNNFTQGWPSISIAGVVAGRAQNLKKTIKNIFDDFRQQGDSMDVGDGKERKFDAGHLKWGIPQALPVADFNDARNGLRVNDSCTFGAEVYVIKNTPTHVLLNLMEKRTSRFHIWPVGSFSLFRKETYSSTFFIEERPWKLCLYPKGHLTGKDKYLSLYLYLEDAADLISGTKLYVDFDLSIRDQNNGGEHKRSVGFWFNSDKDHQGFDDFLPLPELNNPLKGYKADDNVFIEATIKEMFLVTQVR